MDRLADVISLPARRAASTLAGGARSTFDNVVDSSRHMVDDWGRDPDFVARVWTLSRLRWNVAVNGHRSTAEARRRADRRQHPPVRAGARVRGAVDRRRGRPPGPFRRTARHRAPRPGHAASRRTAVAGRRDRRCAARRSAGRDGGRRRPATRARSVTSTTVSSGAAVAAGTKVFPAATASVPVPARRPRRDRARGPPRSAVAVGRSPSSSWPTRSNRRSSNCSTSWAARSPARRSTGCRLSGIGGN